MKKKLILVAAPPACGKTYVSELLAREIGNAVYLDKDDLAPLLYRAFALCGEEMNMDSDFYRENLRSYEYETIVGIALSSLRFSDTVILNAPFGKEVRDADYMRALKAKAEALGAQLILIWVHVSTDVCYERIKARGLERDRHKLLDWDAYVKAINYRAPTELCDKNALHSFFVFDNTNEETAKKALADVLQLLGCS